MKIIVKQDSPMLEYLENNTDYSKKKIKSLLKYKSILINGKVPTNHDLILKKGQTIEISKEKKITKIGNIDIVYEDDNYLVVNKPSGMLTVSTDKEKNRTLYHMVREYIREKRSHEKIFIVHRLDRETSGLVIFCKDENLRDKMQESWDKIAVRREYVAVVLGLMENKKDKLVNYLKENKANLVYVSKNNDGKEAITNYEVIKENKNSLLKILIETGRKNQIRVQLANINHPILGDKKYGNIKGKRLLLCANRLDIRDLKTGKLLSFEINTPREFMRNL